MTASLIRFAQAERPSPVRLDSDGEPRFFADGPDLDELVELGFEQVLAFGHSDPLVMRRLGQLLEAVNAACPANQPRSRIKRLLSSKIGPNEGRLPATSRSPERDSNS